MTPALTLFDLNRELAGCCLEIWTVGLLLVPTLAILAAAAVLTRVIRWGLTGPRSAGT